MACVAILRRSTYANDGSSHSLTVLALGLGIMAAFLLCYGRQSFRAALFPLCCLLLAVPAPAWVLDRFTTALQHGSAAISYEMMHLSGLPVFAQGQKLSLQGLEVEVAPECSGIRSCLAVLLATLFAARVYLRSGWSRVSLILVTIPLALLKNALRISVIVVLSAYVNHAFVESPVHRYGGLIFTPLEIAALAGLLEILRRFESAKGGHGATMDPSIRELQSLG